MKKWIFYLLLIFPIWVNAQEKSTESITIEGVEFVPFPFVKFPSNQYNIGMEVSLNNSADPFVNTDFFGVFNADITAMKKGGGDATLWEAVVVIPFNKELRAIAEKYFDPDKKGCFIQELEIEGSGPMNYDPKTKTASYNRSHAQGRYHMDLEEINKGKRPGDPDRVGAGFSLNFYAYDSYEEALKIVYESGYDEAFGSRTKDKKEVGMPGRFNGTSIQKSGHYIPIEDPNSKVPSIEKDYKYNLYATEKKEKNGIRVNYFNHKSYNRFDEFYDDNKWKYCFRIFRIEGGGKINPVILAKSIITVQVHVSSKSNSDKEDVWNQLDALQDEVMSLLPAPQVLYFGEDSGEGAENVSITTEASAEEGESEAGDIPTNIVIAIGAAVGSGALIAAGRRRRKKKKEAEKQKQKDKATAQEEEEEEEEKKTYEMRIRKDFKNTLYMGVPVSVYARIVEIDSTGKERDVPELTSYIHISSKDGLEVSRNEMAGGYKKAEILVQPQEKPPVSATVDFRFSAGGVSFTNHVRFKIGSWGIRFFQDNVTLPNGHPDTEYLPVFVYGIEASEVYVEVDSNEYEVYVATDKTRDIPEDPAGKHPAGTLYHIAIKENIPEAQKEKNKLKPGEVISYTLKFAACYKDMEIQETIPLFRIGLGLMFDLNAVHCYVDEKTGRVPHTQAHCMVLYWDKENNAVGRGIPQITNFMVLPREMNAPEEESMVSKTLGTIFTASAQWQNLVNNVYGYEEEVSQEEIDLKYEQYLVQKLNIGLEVPPGAKVDPELGLECEVFPQNCALDAPQRFQVTATLYAKFQGESYVCRKEGVELRSQPKRLFMDIDASFEADKQDERIKQTLLNIREAVTHYADLPVNADAMVKLIDLSIKYYSPLYGYDKRVIKTIQKAYSGMLGYEQANALAELDEVESRDKDFLGNLMIIAREGTGIEDSIGLGKRIMLGVCTLGMSEYVFTGCRVLTNMQDAVMSGSGFWMSYLMGCVPVLSDFAFSNIFEYGGKALKKVKNMPSVKRAAEGVKKFFGAGGENVAAKALNGGTGLDYAKGMSKLANEAKKAVMEGDKAVALMKGIKGEADEAWELGMKLARERIGKMRELLRNGQRGSRELQDVVMSIQMDKYAMNILKRMPNDSFDAVNLRMVFNEVMETQNKKVIDSTLQSLAEMFGQPVKNFEIYRASATKKMALTFGETVTFDLDVTYQFLSKNGDVIKIPQQIAENLHNSQLYKTWFGNVNPTPQMVNNFARAMDHSVVQLASKENYGTEQILKKIIDSAHWGNKMTAAEASRAADTIAYKGIHWLNASKESLKKAGESGSLMEKLLHVKDAMINEAEAMRQIVKQAEYMVGKNAVVVGAGGKNSISSSLQACWAVMKKVTQGSLDPTQAKTYIQNTLGYTLEDVCEQTGKVLIEINKRL